MSFIAKIAANLNRQRRTTFAERMRRASKIERHATNARQADFAAMIMRGGDSQIF